MNKKIFIMAILLLLVFYSPTVFAKDIASCDGVLSGNVIIDEKIPSIVSTIMTIIKIVVPVLLVIFGSIDLVKGMVSQKEDEIKKGQQIFIKRLIAGALVFFVFAIVQMMVSFVAGDKNQSGNIMDCVNCFINGKSHCTYK